MRIEAGLVKFSERLTREFICFTQQKSDTSVGLCRLQTQVMPAPPTEAPPAMDRGRLQSPGALESNSVWVFLLQKKGS